METVSMKSAIRVIASTYGILVGLAGIEHGIFEILQGDTPTGDIMINALGPEYRFWSGASERAITIIPTFLLTGILAIVFGILVAIWATKFVDGKYGAHFLLLLTVVLFLVGGGFAPIFLSIIASIVATRIEKPLPWWQTHLLGSTKEKLAKSWPWSIVFFVIIFTLTIVIQIFGSPFGDGITSSLVGISSILMVVLMLYVIPSGFAHSAMRFKAE